MLTYFEIPKEFEEGNGESVISGIFVIDFNLEKFDAGIAKKDLKLYWELFVNHLRRECTTARIIILDINGKFEANES
ncbi:MAG: hypothetical protein RRY79_04285 [Clostridia bacterium]